MPEWDYLAACPIMTRFLTLPSPSINFTSESIPEDWTSIGVRLQLTSV